MAPCGVAWQSVSPLISAQNADVAGYIFGETKETLVKVRHTTGTEKKKNSCAQKEKEVIA